MKSWLIALVIPFIVACDETAEPDTSDVTKDAVSSSSITNRINLDDRLSKWAVGAVSVKAVVFDCAEGDSRLGLSTSRRVVEDGVEHPHIVKNESVFLTSPQTTVLADLLAREHEPQPAAGCYVPHHGFIFYAEDESIVAYIEVCLMCARGGGVPRQGLAVSWDYEGLADFIRSIGLPVFEKAADWPPYFAQHRRQGGMDARSTAEGASE